jgi:hypothetical protein
VPVSFSTRFRRRTRCSELDTLRCRCWLGTPPLHVSSLPAALPSPLQPPLVPLRHPARHHQRFRPCRHPVSAYASPRFNEHPTPAVRFLVESMVTSSGTRYRVVDRAESGSLMWTFALLGYHVGQRSGSAKLAPRLAPVLRPASGVRPVHTPTAVSRSSDCFVQQFTIGFS